MNEDQHELPPNVSDHDLLIVVHTTMRHMARDISTIKDDNTQRLAVLEATKYDKEDAAKAIADGEKVHESLRRDIEARCSKDDAEKVEKQHDKIHEDHEKRMRQVERNMYIAMGALTLLQLALKFL